MENGKQESFPKSPSTQTSNKVYLVGSNVFYTEEDALIFLSFLNPNSTQETLKKMIKFRYINSYVNKIKQGYKWMTYTCSREKTGIEIGEKDKKFFSGYFKQITIQPKYFLSRKQNTKMYFSYSNLVKDKEQLIQEAEQSFLENFLDKRWFVKHDNYSF